MAAIISVIPILLLFVLMMGFKVPGWKSALITLIVTILLAGIYYGSRKLKRAAGKRKGLTPIQLIGISAVLGMIVYR